MGRVVKGLLAIVLLVAVGALGWWAGRSTLETDEQTDQVAHEDVWAAATIGSIDQSLNYSVAVRHPVELIAVNHLSGVVTQIHQGNTEVGTVLYTVGDVPVRAVQGDTPFYRPLAEGARGADVAQLEAALVHLGHLNESAADDRYTAATATAVRTWQRDLGTPATGTIELGELVAVASLPSDVSLGEDIQRVHQLAGGEDAVFAPTGEQFFVLPLTSDQAQLVPADASVRVFWQEHEWDAIITEQVPTDESGVDMMLSAPDGGPVCGDVCDQMPRDPSYTTRGQVVIVPTMEGVSVPLAAVRSGADGQPFVVTRDGEVRVNVVGSARGLAIVEGIDEGVEVRVLEGTAPQSGPAEAPSGG